jgi:hypothetical protein
MQNMTIAQLKEICDQKGLKYNSKVTKTQLIALLNTGETAAKAGPLFKGEH